MTKITIFSGFLGAGKTTLIRKLVAEAYQGEKLVLIENEFGEIGIDSGFLKDSGIAVTEMNSGCICCSLVGDFGTALQDVLNAYTPDRVLIEPSGVGKLSDVIRAVENLHADVVLDGFVTVVDAAKCKVYMKNFGEFFNNQIQHASAILLSRSDRVSEATMAADVEMLRRYNATAPIVTTPWSQLTGAQLRQVIEQKNTLADALLAETKAVEHEHAHAHDEECGCGCHDHEHEHHHEHAHDEECGCGCHDHDHEHYHEHAHDEECSCGCHDHDHEHHHEHAHGEECGCGCHDHEGHHHANEVFSSWGAESPRKYTPAEISFCLEALDSGMYGTVLRAKGIVPAKDGTWIHFDYVPGEPDVRTGAAEYTGRVCVIGANLNESGLAALFGEEA